MINTKVVGLAPGARKFIAGAVLCQWLSLLSNMGMVFAAATLLGSLLEGTYGGDFATTACVFAAALILRFFFIWLGGKASFAATVQIKTVMREHIFQKLLRIGSSYREEAGTAEAVSLTAEGVEQLEEYFGRYLPQFFYSILAPLTLFVAFAPFALRPAVTLLISAALILMLICVGQVMAGRVAAKHLNMYAKLGDLFLESLQGLTTLKVYRDDARRQTRMEEQSESFRKSTMKVLSMQLNSITAMDFIAYAGAALTAIFAALGVASHSIGFFQALAVILLSAEFYLPVRQLGSYFHVSLNGLSAAKRLFALLDLPEPVPGSADKINTDAEIRLADVSFSYGNGDGDREADVLSGVSFTIPPRSFTAIVGASGSGKSTAAAVLSGVARDYRGSVKIGADEIRDIRPECLARHITLVGTNAYLFGGTVRENLLMGKPSATDAELWTALESVNLKGFLQTEGGLDLALTERAENFSGGQRQRLAMARALLRDSPVYIFDEATSNVDVESENDIMDAIRKLTKTKTVILISHRLANVTAANEIIVLKDGRLAGRGTHSELTDAGGVYEQLYSAQTELESYAPHSAASKGAKGDKANA